MQRMSFAEKKLVLWLAVFMVILTGCALAEKGSLENGAISELDSGLENSQAPYYFGEFKELYPNEYASFVSGGSRKSNDGHIHSHAAMRYHTESSSALQNIGASCLSCKTAEFNLLYEEYGEELYNMGYSEISGEVVDYFSCRTCHASGVPAQGAGATLEPYARFAADYLSDIDPEIATCGQCHNATCDWARYLIGKNVSLNEADPYRYGSDADGLRRAAEEDGIYITYDEDVGVNLFYLGHPDMELFVGSTHQELGLSCVSCHMPYENDTSGNSFRNHDSSASPLNNENAMRFCLSCHEAQGITTTAAMRDFVWQKQQEMALLEDNYCKKLDVLSNLIQDCALEGIVSEDELALARENYQTAHYYYSFQHAGARFPGAKVAHAADVMRSYLSRGNELLDEAIAMLER